MLNIALPKGRLGKKVYEMFAKIGYASDIFEKENRKLIIEDKEKNFRYFLVKPSDVGVYVEKGAADIGVVGKDIILETNPDIYEILDLKAGVCKFAVAAPRGLNISGIETLRVATKFVEVAKRYYSTKNRKIEIIKLNGSIEIAPLLNLSDVIVDIVETGRTLKENNLEIIEDILPISARLIANKSSYKFKTQQIDEIKTGLERIIEDA